MGSWNRANVVGTCAPEEVNKLRDLLQIDIMDDRWGYLCNGGMMGLPNWGMESFNVVGNLGERDADSDTVIEHLDTLREACPSLALKVHVGEDYEGNVCQFTITLEAGKEPKEGDPEIETIGQVPREQTMANMRRQMQP